MPLPIQKFREATLQILYSLDFVAEEEIVSFMMQELKATRKSMQEALELAQKVRSKLSEIDVKISEISTEYSFERISKVEVTILRLGVYELLFGEAIPAIVVIAEAIRLARKFGTPESSKFVNAILDGIYVASSAKPVLV